MVESSLREGAEFHRLTAGLSLGRTSVTDQALGTFETEAFDDIELADALDHPMDSAFDSEAPAFFRHGGSLYIARAKGLTAATAAFTAIVLEVSAAFFFYCMWQFWHMLR